MLQPNSAFILVNVDIGKELEVIEEMKKISQVKSIEFVYGEYDFVLTVKAKSPDGLREVVDKMRQIGYIRSTSTMIIRHS